MQTSAARQPVRDWIMKKNEYNHCMTLPNSQHRGESQEVWLHSRLEASKSKPNGCQKIRHTARGGTWPHGRDPTHYGPAALLFLPAYYLMQLTPLTELQAHKSIVLSLTHHRTHADCAQPHILPPPPAYVNPLDSLLSGFTKGFRKVYSVLEMWI